MITWDEVKNKINQKKHGVSFEAAQLVFTDPLHITRKDRVENGELHWQTIGHVGGVLLILVVHTLPDEQDGIDRIRIISARTVTSIERKIYEQAP